MPQNYDGETVLFDAAQGVLGLANASAGNKLSPLQHNSVAVLIAKAMDTIANPTAAVAGATDATSWGMEPYAGTNPAVTAAEIPVVPVFPPPAAGTTSRDWWDAAAQFLRRWGYHSVDAGTVDPAPGVGLPWAVVGPALDAVIPLRWGVATNQITEDPRTAPAAVQFYAGLYAYATRAQSRGVTASDAETAGLPLMHTLSAEYNAAGKRAEMWFALGTLVVTAGLWGWGAATG